MAIFSFAFSQNIALDSMGYYALYDLEGRQKTDWTYINHVFDSYTGEYFVFNEVEISKGSANSAKVRYGLRDSLFNIVIQPQFKNIKKHPYDQYFVLYTDSSTHLLDRKLNEIWSVNEIIEVQFRENYIELQNSSFKRGALSLDAKFQIPIEQDDLFALDQVLYILKDGLFGMASLEKKHFFKPEFEGVSEFDENILRMTRNDSTFYFLNDGTPLPYTDRMLHIYSNHGRLYAKIYHNDKGDLFDLLATKKVLNHEYDDIFPLGPMYFVIVKDGKAGIMNDKGVEIIPPVYQNITDIFNGFKGNSDEKRKNTITYFQIHSDSGVGIINDKNEIIISPIHQYVNKTGNYFTFYERGLWGFYSLTGELLIPPSFNYIGRNYFDQFVVKSPRGFGYLSSTLDTILPAVYGDVVSFKHHYYVPFIEFIGHGEKVLIYQDKIVNRGRIKNFTFSDDWVKCYFEDKIQMIYDYQSENPEYESYPVLESVNVKKGYKRVSWNTEYCTIYQAYDLKNGSRLAYDYSKNTTPYSNYHDAFEPNLGYSFIHKFQNDYIDFFDSKLKVYRYYQFIGNCGEGPYGDHFYSYTYGRSSLGKFSTSEFDRIIDPDGDIAYAFQDRKKVYIGNRKVSYINHAEEGVLNFNRGTDLIRLKDFYQDLQQAKTFEIDSPSLFRKLSRNPMIKIDSAFWIVNKIDNDKRTVKPLLNCIGIQAETNDFLIIQKNDSNYQIRQGVIDSVFLDNLQQVEMIETNTDVFFDVVNLFGKRLLYNKNKNVYLENFDRILWINNYFIKYLADNKIHYYSIFAEKKIR